MFILFLLFFGYFHWYCLAIIKSWPLVLDLRLFRFFFFFLIYFICINFLFYLFLLLLKHLLYLRIQFHQSWVFKKTSFKCLQGQGILATEFTTSRTLLYFIGIFMLNGKQLLNKIDVQNFPQKCLFTLKMIRVFIHVWLNLVVLLPKFSWSQYKGRPESKNS